MINKSFEQICEDYTRQVRENRGKILDDFFLAYAAQMLEKSPNLNLDDICLVEQHTSSGTKFWWEHKPKFDND